jgi:hypothetical protein
MSMEYMRVSEIVDIIPLQSVTEKERQRLLKLKIIPDLYWPVTRKHIMQVINSEVLQAKAELGTEIHKAITEHVQGEFPIISQSKGLGYFESYEMWAAAYMPEYIMMEKRFYDDKLMITGEIDALVTFPETEKIIVDFKTSAKVSLETWRYQAHFYYYLMVENGFAEGLMDTIRFVNLRKDPETKRGIMPYVVDVKFDAFTWDTCVEYAKILWEKQNFTCDVD